MDAGESAGDRMNAVVQSFGSSAGSIGIVIAMAAIIGKCMLDSGAADRIVRNAVDVVGEKKASLGLMISGFVLAIPVFFDTVFYLLVPLARSLHRRTNKNYLRYLMAIATGGAITHTLVPPHRSLTGRIDPGRGHRNHDVGGNTCRYSISDRRPYLFGDYR